MRAGVRTMAAPLDQAVKTPAGAEPATVKTLVLTDLVESTRLFETLGDRRAARLSARHERMARDLLVRCAGREIDKTDGFLLLFERTVDALRFALGYHRALEVLSREEGIEVAARVGIHLGEVIQRKNAPEDVARGAKPVEIEGFAKPMAARVMALAKGRQTLLTRGAFDLARLAAAGERVTDGELRWLAHGPYVLKGVSEPVEIFEVGERGFAPLLVPKSTAKARRAVRPEDELTLGWRPAPGLEVPRRARWRLVEKLGEGGFGEVWRAEHEKTGENRVFKFCYRTESLRSLQREVTLFRLLKETLGSRDDIARILDWSFDQAPYFLECEYTAGGNLLEWVRDQGGPAEVPLATKLELMAQVADALSAAHSVGVLHKDVKPSNVLVTTGSGGRPQVRLTDFGIGLVTDREALARQGITVFDLTEMVAESTGSVGGTHLYMAPELVEGRNATVQADVYALGVMLYQFVIGDFSHALAPGWRRDVADEILQEDLAAMVDGRPERRMRDAQRVAERLRSLEERREAREAARREREEREAERVALEKAHRRRRLSAIVAAASLLVLAVVSFLALQALDARREADRRRG
ncbi:MAG TPA: protein kinase, partial [Thermoanaerobaculia bacterium]